jgi:hypothetical protein
MLVEWETIAVLLSNLPIVAVCLFDFVVCKVYKRDYFAD